eukprot:12316692-Alexandrium_andersonii.AAC.1
MLPRESEVEQLHAGMLGGAGEVLEATPASEQLTLHECWPCRVPWRFWSTSNQGVMCKPEGRKSACDFRSLFKSCPGLTACQKREARRQWTSARL